MSAVPPISRRADAELELASGLDQALRSIAVFEDAAVRRWGSVALGVTDLPPLSEAPVDRAALRAAASLLWAREAEGTGLADFARALVTTQRTGRSVRPPAMTRFPFRSAAMRKLVELRTALRDLPDADERRAFYQQVFAPPFDGQLDAVAAALTSYARSPANPPPSTEGPRVAVQTLARLLTQRTQGGVPYAARRIAEAYMLSWRTLRSRPVLAALGGQRGQVLTAIERHAEMVLGRRLDAHGAARRASAGEALLRWVADHGPSSAQGLSDAAIRSGARVAERWQLERRP